MNEIEFLQNLVDSFKSNSFLRSGDIMPVRLRAEMFIRNVYGETSEYYKEFKKICSNHYGRKAFLDELNAARSEANGLKNLFGTILDEMKMFGCPGTRFDNSHEVVRNNQCEMMSNRVFIVHGHDEEMKVSVARFLEQLGLEPIILHEQVNKNRTIIEKFLDCSEVSFAVVLLSPDDVGNVKAQPDRLQYRARQNVIFELGYFIGKLGREKVVALYNQVEDIETPSDYAGIIYIPYEPLGSWKLLLLKELSTNGFKVDANSLLKTV